MFIPILLTHLLGPMSSHTWFRCDAQISVTWDFSHAGISNLKPWSIGWMNTWTPKDLPLQNRCFKKKINEQMPRKAWTPYLQGIDIYQGIHKHSRLQSPKKNTCFHTESGWIMGTSHDISSWQLPGCSPASSSFLGCTWSIWPMLGSSAAILREDRLFGG